MKKYSKNILDIEKVKKSFFTDNDKLLEDEKNKKHIYSKQPYRQTCKNCDYDINGVDFSNLNIGYSICDNCEHLNGIYEDTKEYTDKIYNDNDGKNYSFNYLNNFELRVINIYKPKLDFIKECMAKENITNFDVTDIGCGGGHFVKSCELQDIYAVGYDVNKDLIELGNKQLKNNKLYHLDDKNIEKCTQNIIKKNNSTILTMIGVLEHLREPSNALKSFVESDCKYLFFSVPCFSLTTFLEHCFPDIYCRHLCAAHTHMYTRNSINFLLKKYNLESIGEWWFGTEIHDMFRMMSIRMNKNNVSKKAQDFLSKFLWEHIDKLQNVLDKNETCSAIQICVKKI